MRLIKLNKLKLNKHLNYSQSSPPPAVLLVADDAAAPFTSPVVVYVGLGVIEVISIAYISKLI